MSDGVNPYSSLPKKTLISSPKLTTNSVQYYKSPNSLPELVVKTTGEIDVPATIAAPQGDGFTPTGARLMELVSLGNTM